MIMTITPIIMIMIIVMIIVIMETFILIIKTYSKIMLNVYRNRIIE